jgi:pimeloyl-ACP methyl ester carboxylesterase
MAKFEAAIGRYLWLEIQGVESLAGHIPRSSLRSSDLLPFYHQYPAACCGDFLLSRVLRRSRAGDSADLPAHRRIGRQAIAAFPDRSRHHQPVPRDRTRPAISRETLPPESQEWWAKEYRLTKSFFIDFHLALKRALDCEKPVFIGSSMGGHLAPDLALACLDECAAVIGLEAVLKTGVGTDDDIRAAFRYFRHPRVNGADRAAAAMYCINGPRSPEKYKREVAWSYSQGAPGVFAGDLNYYNIEYDLRGTAHLIDTTRCPVYIMTGEYDPSTGFKKGEELVAKTNGAVWIPMPAIGHFPMTEDYPTMKPFLMPVLDEIAARRGG